METILQKYKSPKRNLLVPLLRLSPVHPSIRPHPFIHIVRSAKLFPWNKNNILAIKLCEHRRLQRNPLFRRRTKVQGTRSRYNTQHLRGLRAQIIKNLFPFFLPISFVCFSSRFPSSEKSIQPTGRQVHWIRKETWASVCDCIRVGRGLNADGRDYIFVRKIACSELELGNYTLYRFDCRWKFACVWESYLRDTFSNHMKLTMPHNLLL